jgi:serine/threonine protein kinase
MEYGGDSNLKQFIKKYKIKNQFIEEKIIKKIIKQLYFGLKEIHKNKIIHRDLKPENIIINKNNKIKIGDIDISKILTATKKGTLFYKAPEIIKEDKYDNRVDIYSLGCIIYELLTLNEYYTDKILDQKECKINTDIYDKGWQNLIDSLLKKDYKERPNIEEVYTIAKSNNIILDNEISLTININEDDIGKKIYFLDNPEYIDEYTIKDKHDHLKEMNEENTELYINNFKYKFKKYFIPEKEGLYTIKIN